MTSSSGRVQVGRWWGAPCMGSQIPLLRCRKFKLPPRPRPASHTHCIQRWVCHCPAHVCPPRNRRATAVEAGFGGQAGRGCKVRCGQEKHTVPPHADVRAIHPAFSRVPPRQSARSRRRARHAATPFICSLHAREAEGAGSRKGERTGRSGTMTARGRRPHGFESSQSPAGAACHGCAVREDLLLQADGRAHAAPCQARQSSSTLLWTAHLTPVCCHGCVSLGASVTPPGRPSGWSLSQFLSPLQPLSPSRPRPQALSPAASLRELSSSLASAPGPYTRVRSHWMASLVVPMARHIPLCPRLRYPHPVSVSSCGCVYPSICPSPCFYPVRMASIPVSTSDLAPVDICHRPPSPPRFALSLPHLTSRHHEL